MFASQLISTYEIRSVDWSSCRRMSNVLLARSKKKSEDKTRAVGIAGAAPPANKRRLWTVVTVQDKAMIAKTDDGAEAAQHAKKAHSRLDT